MLSEVYALRQALLLEIDSGTLSSQEANRSVTEIFPDNVGVRNLPSSLDVVSANRILSSTAAELGIVISSDNEKRFVRRTSLEKLIDRLGFEASELTLAAVSHRAVPIDIIGLTFGEFVRKFVKFGCYGALLLGDRGQIRSCVSIDMILRKVKEVFQSSTLPSGAHPKYH